MSAYVKGRQPISAATTACGYSPVLPDQAQRSNFHRAHVSETKFRNIDLKEHSFNFEAPVRQEAPYINGKKNSNYQNPTFFSSIDLSQSPEPRRARTPILHSARSHSNGHQNKSNLNIHILATPRDAPETPIKQQNVVPTDITRDNGNDTERERTNMKDFKRIPTTEMTMQSRPSIAPAGESTNNGQRLSFGLDVCDSCYNWQLADEATDKKRKQKESEIFLERNVLEHEKQLLKADKEKEKRRMNSVSEVSRTNYNAFSQKKTRHASKEKYDKDEDIDIKPSSAHIASGALRSLQRYESVLDKMYEASVKRSANRQNNLNSNHSYNKSISTFREQYTNQKKLTSPQAESAELRGRSMMDHMYDSASVRLQSRSAERKRVSEYNSNTANHKKGPDAINIQIAHDPLKSDVGTLEKASSGKSLLERLYQNSEDYSQKKKSEAKDSSNYNRDTSASKRDRKIDFEGDTEYANTFSARRRSTNGTKPSMYVKSFLDVLHNGDEALKSHRKEETQKCSTYNKDTSLSPERVHTKGKTLESYYNGQSKKIGEIEILNYDDWANENTGVLHKMNAQSVQQAENRKAQLIDTKSTLKQQMKQIATKKQQEQEMERAHQEKPVLVCAHRNHLMYCGVCNRKVASNKITKIMDEYNKFMKKKGLVAKH